MAALPSFCLAFTGSEHLPELVSALLAASDEQAAYICGVLWEVRDLCAFPIQTVQAEDGLWLYGCCFVVSDRSFLSFAGFLVHRLCFCSQSTNQYSCILVLCCKFAVNKVSLQYQIHLHLQIRCAITMLSS